MKKMILIVVAVLISPFVFAAEQTVPDGNAFVIAKAVKLGRGKVYSVKGGKSYGAGRFKVEKKCCAFCADCNTATGKCLACESGFALKGGQCVERAKAE